MHWLDQNKIWAEANRILKPGGSIAIWGYASPHIKESEEASQVIKYFHNEVLWKNGYWDNDRKLLDEKYVHLQLPFQHSSRFFTFSYIIIFA